MKTFLFQLVCKTHLHAGSGDTNFGVIDKLVQRDPSDGLPCIYSSSLKGAFREFWEEKLDKKEDAKSIFGFNDKGSIIFHQAFLISIPIRSNIFPFFNVTAPMALETLIEQNKLLGLKLELNQLKELEKHVEDGKILVIDKVDNLSIEDFDSNAIKKIEDGPLKKLLQNIVGCRAAIVSNSVFNQLCSDYSLPVIARNHLENGQSNNLWYEQIIPRESRFIFAVTENPGKSENASSFFKEMGTEKIIQIGANATIGYGQCLISKFKGNE